MCGDFHKEKPCYMKIKYVTSILVFEVSILDFPIELYIAISEQLFENKKLSCEDLREMLMDFIIIIITINFCYHSDLGEAVKRSLYGDAVFSLGQRVISQHIH